MAGKFKVRPIAGHEPVPRFIDQDDSKPVFRIRPVKNPNVCFRIVNHSLKGEISAENENL